VGLVEVPAIFDEDLAKMRFARHEDMVEAFSSNGAQRSQSAFARGARKGVLGTLAPTAWTARSKS
jgi:hypothetical protein